MTSREAILYFGDGAYFVGILLLFGGIIFGLEAVALVGATLLLLSIVVIASA